MSRRSRAPLPVVLFALLSLTGLASLRAQTGPCKTATKGSSPVAQACEEGGVVAAKKTMRALVKKAKSAGVSFECSDCHPDTENYDRLTKDARDKFAQLLAAARPK